MYTILYVIKISEIENKLYSSFDGKFYVNQLI